MRWRPGCIDDQNLARVLISYEENTGKTSRQPEDHKRIIYVRCREKRGPVSAGDDAHYDCWRVDPRIAREFGTPVYVYDATPIVRRISQLKQFDAIRYAQKACSNLAILDLMRRHGVLVDAVSAGEILRAIAPGYQPGQRSHPPEIVFTADLFDRETLEMVVRHDLHVNCGSPDMIDQYGEALASRAVPGPDVNRGITLRINPGSGHGHSQKTNTGGSQSKHGIWHEQIPDCVARAAKHELTITGLHMHIGSGSDMEHLSQVCGAMEKAALKVGPSLTSVSPGGGLPIDYREGRELADTRRYFDLWNKLAIVWPTNSATRSRWRSSPAASSSPRAASSSAKSEP